jgi:hypothetical protein
MNKISRSPERNTFQKEKYLERCANEGKTPSEAYLKMWEDASLQDLEFENDQEQHHNNLEYDLRSTDWIVQKTRDSETYAQNLYAAMCNMQWQKREVMPILKDEVWSCTWRYAGGIVADMRGEGDYIDWYCSGMGDGLGNGDSDGTKGFVAESVITDEIANDLYQLGWVPVPYPEDDRIR